MASNNSRLPQELPHIERQINAFPFSFTLETKGENWVQTNGHVSGEVQHGKRKKKKKDLDLCEDNKNGKGIEGRKLNVPLLDADVKYGDSMVKFKKIILIGMVNTATENLRDLKSGKITDRWHKGVLVDWLEENITKKETDKNKKYAKETLKKRLSKVQEEAESLIKNEQEGKEKGKTNKKFENKMHPDEKETFVGQKKHEEDEMDELGKAFARLKKEIDVIPIKVHSKQVSPHLAKAKKLSAKLGREEKSGEEADDNTDEDLDAEESHVEGEYPKKKVKMNSLEHAVVNLLELVKEEVSQNNTDEDLDTEESDVEGEYPEKKVKTDTVEQAVVDMLSLAKEKIGQNNPQNPSPPQYQFPPQYLPQGYPQYVPYGYPYGIMGAPSPTTQNSGILPPNMFQPPMQGMGSPPMFPAQPNNSQLSQKGQGLASPAPRSVSGEAGQSFSKITPPKVNSREDTTRSPSSQIGLPKVHDRKVAMGPSSSKIAPAKVMYRKEAMGPPSSQIGPPKVHYRKDVTLRAPVKVDDRKDVTSPSSSVRAPVKVDDRKDATGPSSSEIVSSTFHDSVDGGTGPSSAHAPGISRNSVISETERSSNHAPGARRDSVIDQAGHPSHGAATPILTNHGMNPFMYPWYHLPMQNPSRHAEWGHTLQHSAHMGTMHPIHQSSQIRPMVQESSQIRPMVQESSQMGSMVQPMFYCEKEM